jgi:hypothetical protein
VAGGLWMAVHSVLGLGSPCRRLPSAACGGSPWSLCVARGLEHLAVATPLAHSSCLQGLSTSALADMLADDVALAKAAASWLEASPAGAALAEASTHGLALRCANGATHAISNGATHAISRCSLHGTGAVTGAPHISTARRMPALKTWRTAAQPS